MVKVILQILFRVVVSRWLWHAFGCAPQKKMNCIYFPTTIYMHQLGKAARPIESLYRGSVAAPCHTAKRDRNDNAHKLFSFGCNKVNAVVLTKHPSLFATIHTFAWNTRLLIDAQGW